MKFLTHFLSFILILQFHVKSLAQESTPEDLIIDAIECNGNTRTNCEIIKSEIYLNPGDQLNEEEVKNAKFRLQLLNLFKSVDLNLVKGSQRGHVVLNVEVVEDSPLFSETSFYAGPLERSDMYRSLSVKVGHRNLLGQGKVLQATISPNDLLKINDSAFNGAIEYIDPHLFGYKKLFFNARFDHYLYKDKNNNDDDYVIDKYENKLTTDLGLRVFDFSHVSIGTIKDYSYYLFRESLTQSSFQSKMQERNTYTFNYGWNSQDDYYFPTEGSTFDITYYKTDYNFYEKNYYLISDFRKNFLLNHKNIFVFGVRDNYSADSGSNTINLNLQWNYQLRRAASEESITDARLSISPLYAHFRNSDGNVTEYKGIDLGLLMDTKSFGIIRLSTFFMGL